ncbi:MAG: MBL fold metallo-hydrolase [Pseudomonadota bacterium]
MGQGDQDPFDRSHAPVVGEVEQILPGLRVVTAPNAGPMTFTGTQSYIVGEGRVAVLDPGPLDKAHIDALQSAVRRETVKAVLVSHSHRDHSSGAREFARLVGAPVMAHGDPRGARSPLMTRLADDGLLEGGEGIDEGFWPDEVLRDGDRISGPDWELEALYSPGHLSDHLAFVWGRSIFSGDVAMGWATTLISPPDGDLARFRTSIERLIAHAPERLYPGHGGTVEDPERLLTHLLDHRAAREKQILASLSDGPGGISDIVARVYADVPPDLHAAAGRNVFAHLIDLVERGLVGTKTALSSNGTFALR